MVKQIAVF